MQRSIELRSAVWLLVFCVATFIGCRGKQHAHVLKPNDADMVGSHTAGAETYKPLIEESVGKLLGRQADSTEVQQAGLGPDGACKRICFVGVENRSAEEIGDFKEQIYEIIDSHIAGSGAFKPVSKRFVDAALQETRLRPDNLFLPNNQRMFAAALEQGGQPFDYLLFAKITSGTTGSNGDYQRDYVLTLDLVNINTGDYDKESATLRKGYHKSALGKLKHY